MDYINKSRYRILLLFVITIGANIVTTLMLLGLKGLGFRENNLVLANILSVLITSLLTRSYVYSILASILSMLSLSYFFIRPIYSLKVYDKEYILTYIVMLISSLITSTQANKLVRSKNLADQNERQSRLLYRITSQLAKTSEIVEAFSVAAEFIQNHYECDIAAVILDSMGKNNIMLSIPKGTGHTSAEHMEINQLNDFLSAHYSIPVKYMGRTVGFFCLPHQLKQMEEEHRFMLDSILIQVTNAAERILLVRDKENARSDADRERFKSNLLRSISHDLRTPLTRISGASEMISHKDNMDEINLLANEINEEANWLMRLVENILYLTKIQEGRLVVSMQQEAVEEIIAGAVRRSLKYFPGRNIRINVPEEVLFVPMDGKLIEQVLINLINNAIEHSNTRDEILVKVYPEGELVWFEVADHGSGIREEDIPKIFDTFFISNRTRKDGIRGMGLGLAICKEIVEYHGGNISVMNNEEGGATFRFYLHRDYSSEKR